jgi:hypothetical protein
MAALALPTEADYEAACDELARADELVEQLVWRLQTIVDAHGEGELELDRPVTFADVGALWWLVDGVRLDAEQLTTRVRTLEELLRSVDEMRGVEELRSPSPAQASA